MKIKLALATVLLTTIAPSYAVEHWTTFTSTSSTGNVNGTTVSLNGGYWNFVDEGWNPSFGLGTTNFGSASFTPPLASADSAFFHTGNDSSTSAQQFTIDFATPVTDPILHIGDLDATGINFVTPFTLASSNGTLIQPSSTSIQGTVNGAGTLNFSGLYSQITFDIDKGFHSNPGEFEMVIGYEETVVVPEPGSALLASFALLLVGCRRRR